MSLLVGGLERALVALARADAHRRLDRIDEDLAVADVAGLGPAGAHFVDLVDEVVRNDDLDLDLGKEVDRVLAAAVELGVALLPAEAAHLRHGHPDHPDGGERLLHVVQLERLDNRLDLFHHGSSWPLASNRPSPRVAPAKATENQPIRHPRRVRAPPPLPTNWPGA